MLRVLRRDVVVGGADEVPHREVRNRIGLQDARAVAAEHAGRDDVAGIRHTGVRVFNRNDLAEDVGRTVGQQFAEVASAHQVGGNGPGGAVGKDVANPFLAPVPEELALVGVELARPVSRATDVVAELVVVDGRGKGLPVGVVTGPGVRVEIVVAEVFVSGAMEILATGFGDNADLRTGGTTVFCGVGGGQDLHF